MVQKNLRRRAEGRAGDRKVSKKNGSFSYAQAREKLLSIIIPSRFIYQTSRLLPVRNAS